MYKKEWSLHSATFISFVLISFDAFSSKHRKQIGMGMHNKNEPKFYREIYKVISCLHLHSSLCVCVCVSLTARQFSKSPGKRDRIRSSFVLMNLTSSNSNCT